MTLKKSWIEKQDAWQKTFRFSPVQIVNFFFFLAGWVENFDWLERFSTFSYFRAGKTLSLSVTAISSGWMTSTEPPVRSRMFMPNTWMTSLASELQVRKARENSKLQSVYNDYYRIVYGLILPPFPNNWAAIIDRLTWQMVDSFLWNAMVLPPPTLPPLLSTLNGLARSTVKTEKLGWSKIAYSWK
jgi:hypothetical protein